MAKQPERRRTIDPAVADIIGRHEERQADAGLPPKERQKKQREREKIRERREKRVTYDLPPALKQRVAALAEEHSVPTSQMAALLMKLGLKALADLDLDDYKISSRSPRYEHNLDLDKL